MTVTKAHITDSIHKENGLSKEKAARVVDSLFEIVKGTLEGKAACWLWKGACERGGFSGNGVLYLLVK